MSPSANLKVSRINIILAFSTLASHHRLLYIIVTSIGTLSNNNRFRFELDNVAQSRGLSSLIGRMVRTKHVGTVGTL